MMTSPHADIGKTFAAVRSRLGAYLRKHVRDPVAAEDVLQQVFVKALATLQSGHSIGNLTGWLYAVARTTAHDYHRSHRLPSVGLNDEIATDDDSDQRLQQELASCLRPLAEALPDIYRDALIATDFEGQSMRSVADLMFRSTNEVEVSSVAQGVPPRVGIILGFTKPVAVVPVTPQ